MEKLVELTANRSRGWNNQERIQPIGVEDGAISGGFCQYEQRMKNSVQWRTNRSRDGAISGGPRGVEDGAIGERFSQQKQRMEQSLEDSANRSRGWSNQWRLQPKGEEDGAISRAYNQHAGVEDLWCSALIHIFQGVRKTDNFSTHFFLCSICTPRC